MKKNWIMRSAYLVLAVLLISTVAVSGTFAKYTWSGSASDSAVVAKFAFDIGDAEIRNGTEDITINLFNTIKDTDGNDETDVRADMIAPGTQGSFAIPVANKSDVTIAVSFAGTVEAGDIPLLFSLNGVDNWASDLSALAAAEAVTIAIDGENDAAATVYWKWDFQAGADEAAIAARNDADTALGFGANAGDITATATITVTVDQVD